MRNQFSLSMDKDQTPNSAVRFSRQTQAKFRLFGKKKCCLRKLILGLRKKIKSNKKIIIRRQTPISADLYLPDVLEVEIFLPKLKFCNLAAV
jgi:hypothetical protein